MNKLTLDLDALRVDSFGTANAAVRGRVHGQAALGLLGDSKVSCVSCGGATDPCLCDPIKLTAVC